MIIANIFKTQEQTFIFFYSEDNSANEILSGIGLHDWNSY